MGILAGLSCMAAGALRPVEFCICSDSMAALLLLASTEHFVLPVVSAAWQIIGALAPSVLHLVWVPSHCGLEWNERADALAGSAESASTQVLDLVSGSALFKTLRAELTRSWLDAHLHYKATQGSGITVGYFHARPAFPP
eukprot:2476005-Amphidinium_carterae.1